MNTQPLNERISATIATLETVLGQCITALNKPDADVVKVTEAILRTQQALAALRPVINCLVKLEDTATSCVATTWDYALDLLLALDNSQPSYKPRSHAEIVDLVNGLVETLIDYRNEADAINPTPHDNKAVAVNFGSKLQ